MLKSDLPSSTTRGAATFGGVSMVYPLPLGRHEALKAMIPRARYGVIAKLIYFIPQDHDAGSVFLIGSHFFMILLYFSCTLDYFSTQLYSCACRILVRSDIGTFLPPMAMFATVDFCQLHCTDDKRFYFLFGLAGVDVVLVWPNSSWYPLWIAELDVRLCSSNFRRIWVVYDYVSYRLEAIIVLCCPQVQYLNSL